MPVGTQATVKALTQEALERARRRNHPSPNNLSSLPSSRPGNWCASSAGFINSCPGPRAILTDSGGYQVFSLSELRKMTDEGRCAFRSHLDGSEASPHAGKKAAEIQPRAGIGQSPWSSMSASKRRRPARKAEACASSAPQNGRSARAASIFRNCARRNGNLSQLQFGIVQGRERFCRFASRKCAATSRSRFSWDTRVGGLAVGEPACNDLRNDRGSDSGCCPRTRPALSHGAWGRPETARRLCRAWGIDMMDCVPLPTRAWRVTPASTPAKGRVLIKNARYGPGSAGPIDPKCSCSVCRRYLLAPPIFVILFGRGRKSPRAISRHPTTMSTFYLDIMHQIREAIEFGNLANFSSEMHARYGCGSSLKAEFPEVREPSAGRQKRIEEMSAI